jgi:hypothetical protein
VSQTRKNAIFPSKYPDGQLRVSGRNGANIETVLIFVPEAPCNDALGHLEENCGTFLSTNMDGSMTYYVNDEYVTYPANESRYSQVGSYGGYQEYKHEAGFDSEDYYTGKSVLPRRPVYGVVPGRRCLSRIFKCRSFLSLRRLSSSILSAILAKKRTATCFEDGAGKN